MHTILVITQSPPFTERVRSMLGDDWRLVHRSGIDGSEPLVRHGLVRAVLVDVTDLDVQGIWYLEKILEWSPGMAVFIHSKDNPWELDQEAYEKGAIHVFAGTLKSRVFNIFLDRTVEDRARQDDLNPVKLRAGESSPHPALDPGQTELPGQESGGVLLASPRRSLEMARDFSMVLTHALSLESLLDRYLVMLRDLLGINRAAIFCAHPDCSEGVRLEQNQDVRRMPLLSSVGLSTHWAGGFCLSLKSGIGRNLLQQGRILRRDSMAARQDSEIQREFDLVGGQIAVPILDRQSVIGTVLMGGRVTGEPILNSELELIFQMVQHLGTAIKNIGVHDQGVANQRMLTQMLQKMTFACIVLSDKLEVRHANSLACRLFRINLRRGDGPTFSDLPEDLAAQMYQVLQTRAGIEPYSYHPDWDSRKVLQVTILPIEGDEGGGGAVMAIIEDRTQSEQLKNLEIEASSLRLVRGMSEGLAHEIGNALVPLATHEQLLSQKYDDAEFRESLAATMTDGVRRISRLAKQMFFLARERFECTEKIALKQLIDEAFLAARDFYSGPNASLQLLSGDESLEVHCDSAGLKYALTEVMLNALQANPQQSQVCVKATSRVNGSGKDVIELTISDAGNGFSEEAIQRATEPFYSTRTVGIGLGLTVADKIIGRHQGNLKISSDQGEGARQVEIILPKLES